MNKTEITLSACTMCCIQSGRVRMAGLKLVLLARIWERDLVRAGSIAPSPIQYRPCFFPPPNLMTTSPSRSSEVGIVLWPMDLPCHRCLLSEAGVDGRVAVRLGRVLWVVVDVRRRLALVGHYPRLELGDGRATM